MTVSVRVGIVSSKMCRVRHSSLYGREMNGDAGGIVGGSGKTGGNVRESFDLPRKKKNIQVPSGVIKHG